MSERQVYISSNGGYYTAEILVQKIKEGWALQFRDAIPIADECKSGRLRGRELMALTELGVPLIQIIANKRKWSIGFTFHKIQNRQIRMKRVRRYVKEYTDNSIHKDIKNYTE